MLIKCNELKTFPTFQLIKLTNRRLMKMHNQLLICTALRNAHQLQSFMPWYFSSNLIITDLIEIFFWLELQSCFSLKVCYTLPNHKTAKQQVKKENPATMQQWLECKHFIVSMSTAQGVTSSVTSVNISFCITFIYSMFSWMSLFAK